MISKNPATDMPNDDHAPQKPHTRERHGQLNEINKIFKHDLNKCE
jgi:hypothetical protein